MHRYAIDLASSQLAAVLVRLAPITQMLVLGLIERSGDAYYNTALVIAAGRVLGGYRKTFLTGGESVFTVGDQYPTSDCHGVRFGTNICYNAQLPQAAAGSRLAGRTCCCCRHRT